MITAETEQMKSLEQGKDERRFLFNHLDVHIHVQKGQSNIVSTSISPVNMACLSWRAGVIADKGTQDTKIQSYGKGHKRRDTKFELWKEPISDGISNPSCGNGQ